nr:MAG TPA: hypothetical protein [Caudoviricetes sp.]DAK48786.1 MAG TPA: hypothetical protein [Caudoviricetes sp.]DAQ28357.1 MAG TPA: hypothetical protein [Caudoviricetes sp.]
MKFSWHINPPFIYILMSTLFACTGGLYGKRV